MFKKGFTLIELLVVISIIGVLATLLVANFASARARARDAQRKSDIRNIQTALRLYYNDKGSFPASNGQFLILGCGSAGTAACAWGSQWLNGTSVLMNPLPKDPVNNQTYYYAQTGADLYVLRTCLENKSDSNGKTLTVPGWTCPSGWVYEVAS